MPKITGEIRDATTGEVVGARVQVLAPGGEPLAPADAMWKRGPGEPFFYSDGQFSVDAPRGFSQVLVERGTEYTPWRRAVEVDPAAAPGAMALDIALERWSDLPERGWHPGNTHIHYDEQETDPDRRLRYDSRVENLRMTAVSILRRWDLAYATNRYPPGVLTEFTDTHHHVQCGEETRHNHDPARPYEVGYGHVMLLNIHNVVEPVSRGLLIDSFAPDYPPLSAACDDAITQGGLVIWCHNGTGMEAPVAAALGKVHAINLFDPWWMDPEYDLWYDLLNCGIRLPASTGSDWFVSSANRVYAQSGPVFGYEEWLAAVRAGRTFVTNGPALELAVGDAAPGDTVWTAAGASLPLRVRWQSHHAVERVEVVHDGAVVARRDLPGGSRSGSFEADVAVAADGWLAARLASSQRDSFRQPVWAHTSPVSVRGIGRPSAAQAISARSFVHRIDAALEWVRTKGKFLTDAQRAEVVDLHRAGREVYSRLAG